MNQWLDTQITGHSDQTVLSILYTTDTVWSEEKQGCLKTSRPLLVQLMRSHAAFTVVFCGNFFKCENKCDAVSSCALRKSDEFYPIKSPDSQVQSYHQIEFNFKFSPHTLCDSILYLQYLVRGLEKLINEWVNIYEQKKELMR